MSTCSQCNGSGYGPDGGKFCEACEGKGAIPDSADLDPLGGIDTPGTAEPNETIPDSAGPVRDEEYFEHGHSSPHNPPAEVGHAVSHALAELGSVAIDGSAKLNLVCPHCKRIGVGPLGELGPEWDPQADVKEIIPIAEGSKYVIMIPTNTESDILFEMQRQLSEWWADSDPFIIVGDQFKLIKVDEHGEIPRLAMCEADDCPGHIPESGEMCGDVEGEINT